VSCWSEKQRKRKTTGMTLVLSATVHAVMTLVEAKVGDPSWSLPVIPLIVDSSQFLSDSSRQSPLHQICPENSLPFTASVTHDVSLAGWWVVYDEKITVRDQCNPPSRFRQNMCWESWTVGVLCLLLIKKARLMSSQKTNVTRNQQLYTPWTDMITRSTYKWTTHLRHACLTRGLTALITQVYPTRKKIDPDQQDVIWHNHFNTLLSYY
jgi:hypothetical protein